MLRLIVCIAFFLEIKYVENVPVDLQIAGGNDANIVDHPWQVALVDPPSFCCGGSIISEEWVVTAAHCALGCPYIRAGSNDSASGGIVIRNDRVYVHPNYDVSHGSTEYDIALFHLESPLNITIFKPVTLPSQGEELPVGTLLNITGWGKLHESDSYVPLLQQATVPVVSQDICRLIYGAVALYPNVTDNMLCGGFLGTGNIGVCPGDSGGPAMLNEKLIGINSWVYGCGRTQYPSVFTRVSSFVDWIRNHTNISNF